MWIKPAPGFGGNVDFFRALAAELRQQALAAPITINVGGIEKVDAQVDGVAQGSQRFLVVYRTPGIADSPGSKADG